MTQLRMKRVRVTKFNIPKGPINDSQYRAITDDAGEFAHKDDRERALYHALDGLELGTQDVDTLRWLAGWETTSVAVICSWLERARAQGAEKEARIERMSREAARRPGFLDPEAPGPAARYGLPPWPEEESRDGS